MKRALLAATAFFIALFALGFVLGTIRVLFVAPQVGSLIAVLMEVPVMLFAALYACRLTVRRWRVPDALAIRGAMVAWFLMLLAAFETTLGKLLFEQTLAEQAAALATSAGLIGISAQIAAALLPLFIGRRVR